MKKKYNITEIVNHDLCTGCGICVSESPDALKMELNQFGFLTPIKIGDNINENAIRVCPFNPTPDQEVSDEDKLADLYLKDATNYDFKIGRYENTYVGYSNEFRNVSSSGGIATYIFKKILETKIVDNLFIVEEVEGKYIYQFFNHKDEITKISKTRYIPVTLEELFLKIYQINGTVGVSGVACFIKAIRLKQHYHPELKNKIPFLVGIICGGLKSKFFTDYLAQKSGIENNYFNQEYRIKDSKSSASDYSFGAFDEKRKFHQMKMKKVGDMWGTGLFKSNACDFCTDVLTELADISLGDAWLPQYRNDGMGNSIIITRSKIADNIIKTGILDDTLHVTNLIKEQIIASQYSSFTHRQDAVNFRIKVRKLKNKTIPKIRNRNLRSISISYKIVQLQRLRTRSSSLKIWENTPNATIFDKKIKRELNILKLVTTVYHKLRK